MSSNNYLTPYYYPPPAYNPAATWNYNWPASNQTVSSRVAQTNRSIAPPPPPPPLPYSPTTSHTAAPVPPVSTATVTQRPQAYYNSNQSGAYRTRRFNNTNTGQYGSSTGQYAMSSGQYSSNLQYSSTSGQYNTSSGQYNMMNNAQGHSRNFYGKRKSESESDGMKKSNKKKKKPLSQNIPQRKDWSVDDAKRALMVEKEYNKKHKSQSLIIKFPDLELNRDIVSKFHSSIESVHFQQPSTPRFCFVTLNDLADPEVVIKALNKVKFGHGFLTAEFKKDREDEINLGPEDIDPLTLYVGNLAQEVTKDDMVNTYPKQKRIDIGYAKKMKYTRYAFVSFKNVNDSIEAFQKTHATQMYSKSLIVRFRRLNGTVGMPGEPKPQMPQRIESGEHHSTESPPPSLSHPHPRLNNQHNDVDQHLTSDVETEPSVVSSTAPWEMVDVSNWETDTEKSVDFIKQEPLEDSDDEFVESERKPPKRDYLSPFMPGSLDVAFSLHKPILKTEIKREKPEEDNSVSSSAGDDSCDLSQSPTPAKLERNHPKFAVAKDKANSAQQIQKNRDIADADCTILPPEKIKQENIKPESGTTYNSLRFLQRKANANSMDVARVEVKRETHTPTLDETSSDSKGKTSSADTEEFAKVKSEPDNEDETNDDDDDDDSSDSSDDFNFNNILSSIEDRARRLKNIKRSIM